MSEQLGTLELQQLSLVVAAKNYNPAKKVSPQNLGAR